MENEKNKKWRSVQESNSVARRRAMRCLLTEYTALLNEPTEGFVIRSDAMEDPFNWEVGLLGPPSTPYWGGYFKLYLSFTEEYPFEPPKVRFRGRFWHPNVYHNGTVCMSVLRDPRSDDPPSDLPEDEKWSPTLSVRTILLSLLSLMVSPNPDSPANPDASKMYRRWCEKGDSDYTNVIGDIVKRSKKIASRDGVSIPLTTQEYVSGAGSGTKRVESEDSEDSDPISSTESDDSLPSTSSSSLTQQTSPSCVKCIDIPVAQDSQPSTSISSVQSSSIKESSFAKRESTPVTPSNATYNVELTKKPVDIFYSGTSVCTSCEFHESEESLCKSSLSTASNMGDKLTEPECSASMKPSDNNRLPVISSNVESHLPNQVACSDKLSDSRDSVRLESNCVATSNIALPKCSQTIPLPNGSCLAISCNGGLPTSEQSPTDSFETICEESNFIMNGNGCVDNPETTNELQEQCIVSCPVNGVADESIQNNGFDDAALRSKCNEKPQSSITSENSELVINKDTVSNYNNLSNSKDDGQDGSIDSISCKTLENSSPLNKIIPDFSYNLIDSAKCLVDCNTYHPVSGSSLLLDDNVLRVNENNDEKDILSTINSLPNTIRTVDNFLKDVAAPSSSFDLEQRENNVLTVQCLCSDFISELRSNDSTVDYNEIASNSLFVTSDPNTVSSESLSDCLSFPSSTSSLSLARKRKIPQLLPFPHQIDITKRKKQK